MMQECGLRADTFLMVDWRKGQYLVIISIGNADIYFLTKPMRISIFRLSSVTFPASRTAYKSRRKNEHDETLRREHLVQGDGGRS